jgi:hypothetical protein
MSRPSFYQLFRRSKYSRTDFEGAPAAEHNRRELFAVAALGFVLEHDLKFREHFLRTICCADSGVTGKNFEVRCEEHACADLSLTEQNEERCYVIEAKISADLQPHQDPRTAKFVDGYAAQIRRRFGAYKRISYIVLRQSETVMNKNVSGIECFGRRWRDLCVHLAESPLTKDLLDSLALLQISSFQLRQFHGKPMHEKTQTAADMFRFFVSIATQLGISDEKALEWDISNDPEGPFFGFNLKKSQIPLNLVKGSLGHNLAGWLGYEYDENTKKPEPRIWFYCEDDTDQEKMQQLLSPLAKIAKKDGTYISIAPNQPLHDEGDWFVKTLQNLGAKA